MKYRPDIDGLRALAVVSVVFYHTGAKWLPGGFLGVDVFFVISGFVVSASLADSSAPTFWGFLAEFYARRLARIAPALVVMLTFAAIAATLFIPKAWLSGISERTALGAFFGLSNRILQSNPDTYFAPRTEFNPYTHTWSLGVEEQFYVICPMLLFVWVRVTAKGKDKWLPWHLWLDAFGPRESILRPHSTQSSLGSGSSRPGCCSSKSLGPGLVEIVNRLCE
jgi:peptidoglycan/LPS O-acetylase OafA/YrhL